MKDLDVFRCVCSSELDLNNTGPLPSWFDLTNKICIIGMGKNCRMAWRWLLVFFCLVAFQIFEQVRAFTHPSRQQRQHFSIPESTALPTNPRSRDNDNDAEDTIESIVLTLSNEPSDDIRRETLRKQLTGYLDAGHLEIAQCLDACIVATGARLQNEESANQKQLWALVDMMVQTKTIINRFQKKSAEEAKE